MDTLKLMNELKEHREIIPDEHDGSYELMRETINAYATIEDFSTLDFNDLDLIYFMAIMTSKDSCEAKKERVRNNAHLSYDQKTFLLKKLDEIWENAALKKYSIEEDKTVFFGMFGKAFSTFGQYQSDTWTSKIQDFIRMLTEIKDLTNDTEIFDRAEQVLKYPIKGLQAGTVSTILHCLKPYTFPIINGNQGKGDIFEDLGIALKQKKLSETYIANCRTIKQFRDAQFSFKNYRVFDLVARKYKEVESLENGQGIIENEVDEVTSDIESKNSIFDHNIILYGPPGTGKTYHMPYYAVAIVENEPLEKIKLLEYDTVLEKFKKYKSDERIAFTTFHQSYGYEEFIEGIRPILVEEETEVIKKGEVQYQIKSGVFKQFCERARNVTAQKEEENWGLNDNPTVWKVSLEKTGNNPTREDCMKNNHIRIGWDEYGPDITRETQYQYGGTVVLNAFYNKMKVGDIVVSCFSSEVTDAIGVITGEAEWDDSYHDYKRVRNVRWLVKGISENILKINDNKPMVLASVYKMDVSVEDILNLVRKNLNRPEITDSKKNYVFIIDEINRGNISKIFGELITLIEDSKRIGAKEELQLKLPYSGKPFGVPDNVYIIGTMNTADRSIALMDTALRRRFRFIEMQPDPEVIKDVVIKDKSGETLRVSDMLEIINKRVECLFDREHTIGHAFFTSLMNSSNPSIEALGAIFEKSIIPLLQEYFYEDYEKIRLVLGDNAKSDDSTVFVRQIPNENGIFSGNVSDDEFTAYRYEINKDALTNIRSYKGISKAL